MAFLNLKIPPLLLMALYVVLLWLIDPLAGETARILTTDRYYMAAILFLAGCGLVIPAGIRFFKEKTTVDPRVPDKATTLVTTGLYAHSRNPMYVGFLLVILSVALALGSYLSLVVGFSFVPYMNRFQIRLEEYFLAQKFGAEYEAYLRDVRRWI